MVGEELLHDDIFVPWAETFAIPVSIGVEDILDEQDDGVNIAKDLRLHGPKRQRGLRRSHNRRGGELRSWRERRGRGITGSGRPREKSTAGHQSCPRRETGGAEEDERGPGAGE